MDTFIKIIISPQIGFEQAIKEKSLEKAALIVLVTSLIKSILAIPDPRTLQALRFLPVLTPGLIFLLSLPLFLIIGVLGWLIMSLLFQGLAKLFKGQWKLSETLIVTGYAQLPYFFSLLLTPLILIQFLVREPASLLLLISLTISFVQLILSLWVLILLIIGLKQAHYFGYGKATGTACLPGCGCLLLIAGIVLLAVVAGLLGPKSLTLP